MDGKRMNNYKTPTNNLEAFTLALRMAVEAPNDDLSSKATARARSLAARLTAEQVNGVKAMLEAEAA